MPQEIATHAFFARSPELVWRWYLYRRELCLRAQPNAAHTAIVQLERLLGQRFHLVTQNVDGLHQRAGSKRLLEIHGNLHHMRCDAACHDAVWPVPPASRGDTPAAAGGGPLTSRQLDCLRCPRCGGWGRPHVLWFDEAYDETFYRRDSAVGAVQSADLLLVAGTSGATTLPMVLAALAATRRIPIVNVDPGANAFASLPGNAHVPEAAEVALPRLAAWVAARRGGR